MERLTMRDKEFPTALYRLQGGGYRRSETSDQEWCNLLDRLADYEDTGLTPEEITNLRTRHVTLLEMYEASCNGYVGLWNELQDYQNSDDPEIIKINFEKEAMERQTPEKPSRDCGGYYCPNCNEWIDELRVGKDNFCRECGQAFDWEGVKTDE